MASIIWVGVLPLEERALAAYGAFVIFALFTNAQTEHVKVKKLLPLLQYMPHLVCSRPMLGELCQYVLQSPTI